MKFKTLFAVLLAFTLLAAACGDDDDETSSGSSGTCDEVTTTVDGTLTVATGETVFPPWMGAGDDDFDDPTTGTGYEGALVYALAEELGFAAEDVTFVRTPFDTVIAPGTLRGRTIPKCTLVFAATLSAMFDRRDVADPHSFRTDRHFETYIIWGIGMHTCFGAAINAAVIPAILTPLLTRNNLRRADGAAGQVETGGTPFPQHFTVTFDPA